jgi:hypothetical protein
MFNGFTRQITGHPSYLVVKTMVSFMVSFRFSPKKRQLCPDLAGAESGNAPHPRPTATPEARDMAGLSGLQITLYYIYIYIYITGFLDWRN